MMRYEVQASIRKEEGSSASRRLRKQGHLPAVVYGEEKKPLSLRLDHNQLYHLLKKESFHTALIDLTVEGHAKEQVLLRDIQYHPFKEQILHIDFMRVSENKKIDFKVPLHFMNADHAPGVKLHGGSINHTLTMVEVRCLASHLPEYIAVDLSHLDASKPAVHLSELSLPEGVELKSLVQGEDLTVAVLISAKRHETDDEVTTPSPEA